MEPTTTKTIVDGALVIETTSVQTQTVSKSRFLQSLAIEQGKLASQQAAVVATQGRISDIQDSIAMFPEDA